MAKDYLDDGGLQVPSKAESLEHAQISGVHGKKVFVVDSSGNQIDGSTSSKQDSQITLETTLNSLIETLQELTQRLAPLAGAVANTAQLRTVVTGSVTATGGGYITSAQHIANTLTQTNSLISSQRLEHNNLLPVTSNINNVSIN